MAVGQHGRDGLVQHDLGRQVVDERRPAERGVEPALAQAGDERRDRELLRLQRDPRVALAERPHERRHDEVRDRGEEADAQLPLLTARRAAHRRDRPVRLRQDGPRLAQQHLADAGERRAAGAALEQRDAELELERPHLLRQRLLGDVEPGGGAREAARLGDGDERAQLPQLRGHGSIVSQAPPVAAQATHPCPGLRPVLAWPA